MAIPVLFSLLLFIAMVYRYQRTNRKQLQERGLRLLIAMRHLVADLQKHRGLANGFLLGDCKLWLDIEEIQNQVSLDFGEVAAIDSQLDASADWQAITQHWARLAGKLRYLKAGSSFNQHNQLVSNVLHLTDEVVQRYNLYSLRNNNKQLLYPVWRALLSASESVGQARAIGTGVAAAKFCDNLSRARLQRLCGEIDENCNQLWQQLTPVRGAPSAIEALLFTIHEQILLQSPAISASEFFTIATRAVDLLLQQFDQLVREESWH